MKNKNTVVNYVTVRDFLGISTWGSTHELTTGLIECSGCFRAFCLQPWTLNSITTHFNQLLKESYNSLNITIKYKKREPLRSKRYPSTTT